MQPIIGITTSVMTDTLTMHMGQPYPRAVLNAGGTPILLPATEDAPTIARYAQMIDGLLLSGGDDIDPQRYGDYQTWACGDICPLRDAFEIALCHEVLRLGKPIFGICRGLQLLNTALGGKLHQDLPSEVPTSIAHRQQQKPEFVSHPVAIVEGSRLHQVLGTENLPVNSHHHQAIKAIAPSLTVTATAPDGVIEAVEMPDHAFCLAVQWHPERLWDQPSSMTHARLFEAFVQACQQQ